MSTAHSTANPAPPVSGAPQPHVSDPQIPQVDIPHMGTSQPQGAQPPGQGQTQSPGQPQGPAQQPVDGNAPGTAKMPPLPDGISQADVDAAIAHVEKTGGTDGIDPRVLAAACAQIEAQAAHHGIALTGQVDDQTSPQGTAQTGVAHGGPSNYVEAAVMDKQTTFDNFHQQRDNLKAAVAEQREAAQKPYQDALDKSGQGTAQPGDGEFDPETIRALAQAIHQLDPDTIALINAMSALNSTPGVLKGIVWMEIVRVLRKLIAQETQSHVEQRLNPAPQHQRSASDTSNAL